MGMDHLRVPEIGKLGTSFDYEGEGEVVWNNVVLFHLAKEKKGLVGMVFAHGCSYWRVPFINS